MALTLNRNPARANRIRQPKQELLIDESLARSATQDIGGLAPSPVVPIEDLPASPALDAGAGRDKAVTEQQPAAEGGLGAGGLSILNSAVSAFDNISTTNAQTKAFLKQVQEGAEDSEINRALFEIDNQAKDIERLIAINNSNSAR